MDGLLDLQRDILASLSWRPGTLEDLLKRDFLHNRSEEGISRILDIMERKKWIYETPNEKFKAYKAAVERELSDYG